LPVTSGAEITGVDLGDPPNDTVVTVIRGALTSRADDHLLPVSGPLYPDHRHVNQRVLYRKVRLTFIDTALVTGQVLAADLVRGGAQVGGVWL
jgi:hypothetical protein